MCWNKHRLELACSYPMLTMCSAGTFPWRGNISSPHILTHSMHMALSTPLEVKKKQGFVATAGFSFFKGNAKVVELLEHVLESCTAPPPEDDASLAGNNNNNNNNINNAPSTTDDPVYCDDQRELNLYYHQHITWDKFPTNRGRAVVANDDSNLYNNNATAALYSGKRVRTGIDEQSGLRVLLLPPNFANRGGVPKDPSRCPQDWWAGMPISGKNAASKERVTDRWLCTCGGGGRTSDSEKEIISIGGGVLNCAEVLK